MTWWKSVVSLAVAAATIFEPQLQHFIAAHPAIVTAVGSAFTIWAHLSGSPLDSGK